MWTSLVVWVAGCEPASHRSTSRRIERGLVFEHGGMKVTAFEVDHSVSPAFGYRIDFNGRSVVISGDTRYSEGLIRNAQGVDVLIHEVVFGSPYEF